MNSARSFGPDLAIANLSAWWAYLIGPVAGAVIAVGFARRAAWAGHRAGSLCVRGDANQRRATARDRGFDRNVINAGTDWIITWYPARHHGIALVGAPASEVVPDTWFDQLTCGQLFYRPLRESAAAHQR
jgi:major intrinsic protein